MHTRRLRLGTVLVLAAAAVAVWGGVRAMEVWRVQAALGQAKQEMAAGFYTKALNRLIQLSPSRADDGEVDYQLGLCELYRGRPAAALAAWDRVPPGTPFATRADVGRARLAIDLGEYTRAEEILRAALRRAAGTERSELFRLLEQLYRLEGRIDDARQVVIESWEVSDSPAVVVKELYLLDTAELSTEMTRVVLEKAAAGDDRVWLARASLAIKTGRFDEAARWLNACLERRPDDPIVWRDRRFGRGVAGPRSSAG
jgi:enediyne biosynthesis protein E4